MTDYLGPLTLGTSGTYALTACSFSGSSASLTVAVTGATADTMTAAREALVAQLAVGNTYVHWTPGGTYPVVYRIVGVEGVTTDEYQGVLAAAPWSLVSFTLNLAGQPAGALTTLYSAQHVDTPASVALSALLGTHPTPLDVTIDDDAGTDMHSVWAALAPTALSDAKWLVDVYPMTWTTMSNGTTDAAMWFNRSRYTTSSSYQTTPLDTSQYPAGKYRLLARVKQAAGTGYIKDSQNDVAVAVTKTTPHLLVVGDLDLPVSDTAAGSASNLTLSARSDGTNRLDVNAFVLLPLNYGFFSWHPDTSTTEIDRLDVGPSGIYMWTTGTADGITDMTYFSGGILTPRVLAAHVGTLVTTASPSGANWPTDWTRTNGTDVTADTSRFKVVCAAASSKYAIFAATNATTPLIVPGAWYELSFTRDVDSWSAGAATASIVWQDVDGNTVRTDVLSTTSANDASPLAVTVYAKAPAHAARAQLQLGGTSATLTVFFSNVVLRRCPLRLIVVVEDAAGALSSNTHAVALTVKYTPKYEIAR